MEWTRIVGLIGVLAVVVTAVGALYSLTTSGLLSAPFLTAAAATTGLVAVVVLAMVLVGRRNDRWTDNAGGHYW